jgi:hypothetical protein
MHRGSFRLMSSERLGPSPGASVSAIERSKETLPDLSLIQKSIHLRCSRDESSEGICTVFSIAERANTNERMARLRSQGRAPE